MQVDQKMDNTLCSAATNCYQASRKLFYIEKSKALTPEHVKMYNVLRKYVDDIITKKIAWNLAVIPPRMVQLVDSDQKTNDNNNNTKIKQKKKILKPATNAMYAYLIKYATESAVMRYLTGSDYRLEIAKHSILETVQWRVSSEVDKITPTMFENPLKLKALYCMNQRDKKGHPIAYFKILNTLPDDPWLLVKAAVWCTEKCVKLADEKGLHQVTWIVDIENLSYSTTPPTAVLKEISHLMQHYFPERLYRAYLVFAPWYFRIVWKIVSQFLTANTKGKVIVPGWYESAKYDTFKEHIDKSQLPKRYGGDYDVDYSYQWELTEYLNCNKYITNNNDNNNINISNVNNTNTTT